MTWTSTDLTKPVATSDGTAQVTDTRNNFNSEFCWSMVRTGARAGFARTTNANGTSIPFARPTEVYYRLGPAATTGSVWIKIEYVWGTSGGALNNVTQATYFFSRNGGATYERMLDGGFNRASYAYNADGTPVTTSFPTWSVSP